MVLVIAPAPVMTAPLGKSRDDRRELFEWLYQMMHVDNLIMYLPAMTASTLRRVKHPYRCHLQVRSQRRRLALRTCRSTTMEDYW